MSRPKQIIKEEDVSKLALDGCSTSEIALIVGCNDRTLLNRFSKLLAKKRAERRQWLREQQNEAAKKGNPTILIWLGKQELDQVDKRPPPEQSSAYLDAMDFASAEHDRANPFTPGPIEE